MRILFYWILYSMCFLTRLAAQDNWPPSYEIKTDTVFEHDLSSIYWQVMKDETGKLVIDQINQLSSAGTFLDSSRLKLDNSPSHVYWFRYRLRNTTVRDAMISLDARSEREDFYTSLPNDKWRHFVTGSLYPL